MKGYKTPPQGVAEILKVVIMVLNHDVNSFDNDAYQWPEIKKKVSDSKFIQKCLRFEPSTMTMEESKRVYDAHLNSSVKSAAALKLL